MEQLQKSLKQFRNKGYINMKLVLCILPVELVLHMF